MSDMWIWFKISNQNAIVDITNYKIVDITNSIIISDIKMFDS